jgi:hypothetical protein
MPIAGRVWSEQTPPGKPALMTVFLRIITFSLPVVLYAVSDASHIPPPTFLFCLCCSILTLLYFLSSLLSLAPQHSTYHTSTTTRTLSLQVRSRLFPAREYSSDQLFQLLSLVSNSRISTLTTWHHTSHAYTRTHPHASTHNLQHTLSLRTQFQSQLCPAREYS